VKRVSRSSQKQLKALQLLRQYGFRRLRERHHKALVPYLGRALSALSAHHGDDMSHTTREAGCAWWWWWAAGIALTDLCLVRKNHQACMEVEWPDSMAVLSWRFYEETSKVINSVHDSIHPSPIHVRMTS
jgi:hypothetical protein